MPAWILIIHFSGYGNIPPTVIEFSSRPACMEALTTLKSFFGGHYTKGVCISRSTGKVD